MNNAITSKKSSYKCDLCRDTGWILTEREKYSPLARPCQCRQLEITRNQWKSAGINTEMSNFTFSNFNIWNNSSRMCKDVAMNYFSSFINIKKKRQNSILFSGQPGSGKTHLSISIALNLINSKTNSLYMPYRDVITNLKQNILDKDSYTKIISKYKTCDVLVIDDLFKGKLSEADINIMFELINYRYLNYLPIIISTELTIEKLLSIDESVSSRIYEMCKDFLVVINNTYKNNYRLR